MVVIIFILTALCSCSNVAITGRKQLNFIPNSTIMSMSFQEYSDFVKQNKVSTDPVKTQMVKRVGGRIQKGVEQYLAQTDQLHLIEGYEWEYTLIEDDQINAWVMPGGKVVVYTGLLPVAKDDTGLAVVLGHEIAHAIANHGGERMSQAMVIEVGAAAMNKAMEKREPRTREIFSTAFGISANVGVMLPFSRVQEYEADHIGLIFMAIAGYDPSKAIDFWQRMADQKEGGGSIELLSTHPTDENRIARIKQMLPEAMKYYQGQGS